MDFNDVEAIRIAKKYAIGLLRQAGAPSTIKAPPNTLTQDGDGDESMVGAFLISAR